MVKRILLIAPRTYLRPFDYSVCAARAADMMEYNSGNAIFGYAIERQLIARDVEVVVKSLSEVEATIEEINADFQLCVHCPANLINLDFRDRINRLAATFAKMRIPVLLIGVGAQSCHDYNSSLLASIAASVSDLIKAVARTGGHISCRGTFTGEVLRAMGYKEGSDYSVHGCPSFFAYGPVVNVCDVPKSLAIAKFSFNGPEFLSRYISLLERDPAAIFVSQDSQYSALYTPLEFSESMLVPSSLMTKRVARLIDNGQVRMFCDCESWRKGLVDAGVNFSLGTRIHGNVAAILSGIPAHVLTKDSRVREIVEFYDIPHSPLPKKPFALRNLEYYLVHTDYTAFCKNLPNRYHAFKTFMNSFGASWGESQEYINAIAGQTEYPMPSRVNVTLEFLERYSTNNATTGQFRKVLGRILSAFIPNPTKRKLFRRSFQGK